MIHKTRQLTTYSFNHEWPEKLKELIVWAIQAYGNLLDPGKYTFEELADEIAGTYDLNVSENFEAVKALNYAHAFNKAYGQGSASRARIQRYERSE